MPNARLARLRSGFVPVGNLVLHEVGGGRGRSPVVFLHGAGSSGLLEWRYVLPVVGGRRRVLAPDFPGFGFSMKPPLRYGIPLFERTLLRYLDRRRLRRPLLVGASMGGRVAIEFALRHPERVSRLILVDSLGFGMPRAPLLGVLAAPVVGDLAYGVLQSALGRMEPEALRNLASRVGMSTETLDDTHLGVLREIHQDPGAGYAQTTTLRSLALHSLDDVTPRLQSLAVPIRLIWGSEDPIFPVGLAVRAQRRLPNSKLAIIEGARHEPQLERPDTFLEALLHYLDD